MATVTYKIREGFSNLGVPVAVLGERIESLKKRNASPANPEGFVTVDDVIEDAKPPGSPLHRGFTWDLEKAAQKHWRQEALYLMRCYEVHYIDANAEPIVISPANVRVTAPDKTTLSVSTPVAMSDDDYRRQVLEETAAILNGAQKRLAGLRGISPAIILAIGKAKQLIEFEAKAKKSRHLRQPAEVTLNN